MNAKIIRPPDELVKPAERLSLAWKEYEVIEPEWNDRHYDKWHQRTKFDDAGAQVRYEKKRQELRARFGETTASLMMDGTEGWGIEIVGLIGLLFEQEAATDELEAWMMDEDIRGLKCFDLPTIVETRKTYQDPEEPSHFVLEHERRPNPGWKKLFRAARHFSRHRILCEYQSRYTFVKDFGGQARICWHDENGRFRHRSLGSFKQAEEGNFIEVANGNGGTKRESAADYWLKSTHRRTAERAVFEPGRRVPPDVFNIWRGWPVKRREGLGHQDFLGHMWFNMCEEREDLFHWLIGWMADAVQNQHRTAGTAVVLRGPQGSGKNFWAERFMELFGPHALTVTNAEQVTGKFNAHLQHCSLLFANEAFFAGSNKEKNALKSLVTDGQIMVEPKGVDPFPVEKKFRLVIASNEEWVINVEESDRRFLVLEVDAGQHNNDREYFGQIMKDWVEGGREALLAVLYDWNGRWDEGRIPETRAKLAQRELSLPPFKKWVHEQLDTGELPSSAELQNGWQFVVTDDLPAKSKAMAAAMQEMGASSKRMSIDGSQRRGWHVPPLDDARANWARATGLRREWLAEGEREDWAHRPNCSGFISIREARAEECPF